MSYAKKVRNPNVDRCCACYKEPIRKQVSVSCTANAATNRDSEQEGLLNSTPGCRILMCLILLHRTPPYCTEGLAHLRKNRIGACKMQCAYLAKTLRTKMIHDYQRVNGEISFRPILQ